VVQFCYPFFFSFFSSIQSERFRIVFLLLGYGHYYYGKSEGMTIRRSGDRVVGKGGADGGCEQFSMGK
jgi:hypothetical protein